MRKSFALVACALAAAYLCAGPASAANASVSIVDYSFQPSSVTINVGESVTWTHQGTATHTVTGDGFDSGDLTTGKMYTRTFSQPGSFSYHCKYHSVMTGTVNVQGSGGPAPTQPPAPAPAPKSQPAPAAAPAATAPRTTAAPPPTAAPTTTSSPTTTIAPPAAADAGTTSSTLAAAGGGVALPAQKTSTGSDDSLSPWLIALAVVLLGAATVGGVLLRRRAT